MGLASFNRQRRELESKNIKKKTEKQENKKEQKETLVKKNKQN
ncbi:hypothetical protein SAMN05446037_100271 [Anaerovirgula multivorans]|uniref:Uncharacterized protein n=1 Tax=Anaerovirgula multivorans TaxID=312168 RepID=A0A239AIR9_9FIRM|nr:hypothetical protein [Anaerovirgula multivorans]SNR95557.1 hypothetical protein SAMN05446037_100271 [Anaerovirgula multivorans]